MQGLNALVLMIGWIVVGSGVVALAANQILAVLDRITKKG